MGKLFFEKPSNKKNFFSDKFDNTTTLGFGAVQPICCSELVPQSSVNLRVNSFVRLSPLVKPVYGRLNLHSYTFFCPLSEVYHPWDSLLSQTSFNGGSNSYIPTKVPFISSDMLLFLVLSFSSFTVWSSPSGVASEPSFYDESDAEYLWITKVLRCSLSDAEHYKSWLSFIYPSDLIDSLQHNYAGYTFQQASDSADYCIEWLDGTTRYFIFFRFSDFTKNIRSILLGLGYQLSSSENINVSLLPLFAFYRCYFDLFFPKRYLTYKDSALYKLIEYIELTNEVDVSSSIRQNVFSSSPTFSDLPRFFCDLAECYYTSSPDYVSAHHFGVSTNNSRLVFNTPSPLSTSTSAKSTDIVVLEDSGAHISVNTDISAIGRTQLRVLNFLSKYINKNTYIGAKVDELLRAHYNSASSCSDSFLIDSYVSPIEISDVMNQSASSEGYLGEYAGKGIGISRGKGSKFKTDVFGYLIHVCCVVPDSGYAQTMDPLVNHVNKFSFFQPDLDGLTLVSTPKYNIYCANDFFSETYDFDANLSRSFGNIPIYSEYKMKNSILNGDISLHSTRSSLASFTLDKLLPYAKFPYIGSDNYVHLGDNPLPSDSLVNGTFWRYVGRYRYIGNYDRIFYNKGYDEPSLDPDSIHFLGQYRLDDNFIIHNYIQFDRYAPMLKLGESFDTGSDDFEEGHSQGSSNIE